VAVATVGGLLQMLMHNEGWGNRRLELNFSLVKMGLPT
jgi:hypothetical protein